MMYCQLAAVIFIASCVSQSNCFESHRSPYGKKYLVGNLQKDLHWTYEEARKLCEANNATLVQIKSSYESEWMKDNIHPENPFPLGVRPVHGYTDAPTHFLDGMPITWYNWGPREPSGSYPCIIISVDNYSFKWFKKYCFDRWNTVICEPMPSMSSYMEQLVMAVDELETTVMKDRANITLLLEENQVLRSDSAKKVGPALEKVIHRIWSLTKATR